MSLRPRYSLLTLLVLTALVAGGVKLWYGPHHLVVGAGTEEEDEYSYTRDWQGNKVIHGPRILRTKTQGRFAYVDVRYYRLGQNQGWVYNITSAPILEPRLIVPIWHLDVTNPLTAAEQQECEQILARERPADLEPGVTLTEYIGVEPIKEF